MKISGVLPLRNAVKLQYPFDLAIRSLRMLCDEVVVLVDPMSEDDTLARVQALQAEGVVHKIVPSVWNMDNHDGHTNCEITVQTNKAIEAATGDWIFSLQADEVLHEHDIEQIKIEIAITDAQNETALDFRRLYFYGSLDKLRDNWSIWMVRCFKRGFWKPDVDGAMRFDPIHSTYRKTPSDACIYHYSRIGDPKVIAERVRNLDRFFHTPDKVAGGALPDYDFSSMRKLDTYVKDAPIEADIDAELIDFPIENHPAAVRAYFHV